MLFQYFYIDFKICKLIFHCRFYSCYVINIKSFPWNRIIRQYHELIHFKWEIRGNISFLENQLSSTNNWFLNQQQSLTIKRLMTDDAHKMSLRDEHECLAFNVMRSCSLIFPKFDVTSCLISHDCDIMEIT